MKNVALTLVLIAMPVILLAQPNGPGSPTPLGLTELLLGAGAVVGIRKKLKSKNN